MILNFCTANHLLTVINTRSSLEQFQSGIDYIPQHIVQEQSLEAFKNPCTAIIMSFTINITISIYAPNGLC